MQMFEDVKKIPGAISMTESVGIYRTVIGSLQGDPHGVAVDLGSNAGKSSIVGAKALADVGFKGRFFMVDLAYDLMNPEWKHTTQGDADLMPWGYLREPNAKATIKKRVEKYYPHVVLAGLSSIQFLSQAKGPVSYAFIDSDDHQVELVHQEVRMLEHLVSPGGLVFFHDFRNQYIGPAKAYEYLISTGKYEAIEIDWKSAIEYAKENKLEDGNDSWHMPGVDFPIFVGCVRRKQ